MTLDADEFIRRFLLHVLPDGFQRIRHYGFPGPPLSPSQARSVPPTAGRGLAFSRPRPRRRTNPTTAISTKN